QAAFDLADAAGTADALDGEVEMRQATVAPHERRKIKPYRHDGLSSQENTVLGAKHARAPAPELDLERPPADHLSGRSLEPAGRRLVQGYDVVAAPVGRMHEPRDRLQARERAAGGIGRDELDH